MTPKNLEICHGIAPYRIYRDIPRPSVADLRPFDELGVADVIDGLPAGSLLDLALRPIWPGARILGPAVTALNVPGDTLMLHYAVEICRPGDVLVLVSEGENPSALWGKMVSVVAQARGAAGAIVDGFVRDTAYIRESAFPVWARAISPRGSTCKGPGSLNVPVVCGGVTIHPGDWILADDDGIVVIPPEQRTAALEFGLRRRQREEAILPHLHQGVSPFEILGLAQAVRAAGLEEHPGCSPDVAKIKQNNKER
jgi:4-hydroxy-4-methyl-2-oxoglutarate aldolase